MPDKFTLYWLDESRSHRIMWMLELLGLEYEVDVHLRHPETWRGPAELFNVHPLGKAPVLEIKFADGRPNLQLAETGLIMQYLLKHYDPSFILTPKREDEQLMVDYFIHYSEGTLQPILMAMLINTTAKRVAPIGLKTVAKLVTKGLNNGYYIHEFKLNLEYLNARLREEGTGFFVAGKLTAADIMLSFPVYENLFDNEAGVKECSGETDLYRKFPLLGAWCDKVKNDPIYSRITTVMRRKVEEIRHEKRRR
ncbi:putative glutathione S-transferase [Clavispora lusitaniae]|uniref:Glutathione S-transferase n=1 Tax=Clavispora lusitaniae TaxID=36911 RepID=A0ACD0WIS6_CLALS|nr:putative glutathione S-transferase [Clavispora lusitaniae]QFZ33532.1 putative glutathione S-transferase [Clavispora lusitaniae]QFZ39203.1 putative glutathione S-transferase [Clavispora lusitaniae]QFZ44885.1 putative glutathione S-transferase [Clavispora lusitaniae]QFZ50562.1 putative glutathione S-transferase [Clavispora lusitaniae]